MKIVSTFHPSSSVVSSVKCRLASRDLEHLVIAKLDRVDVYSLQPNGLRHECGLDVWGKVLCVRAIPISGTERSKLALMTSHPDPELVFFSYKETESGGSELTVQDTLSLYERSPREAEFYNDLIIHPSGTVAIASCYVGKLKVIKLKAGGYVDNFDFSLLELNVLSLAFLPTQDEVTIAILHLDYQSRVQLLAREIHTDSSESDVSTSPSTVLQSTVISNRVIPSPTEAPPQLIAVPPSEGSDDEDETSEFLGGVLVIGGRSIVLYELASEASRAKLQNKAEKLEKLKANPDQAKAKQAKAKQAEREGRKRKATASLEWPWDEVATWCAVDGAPLRFFIGDVYGGLTLLSLEGVKDGGMLVIPLGMTSPATTMNYLTNQSIFVGSHLGDSQLLHIWPSPGNSMGPVLSVPPEFDHLTVERNALNSLNNKKGKGRATEPDDMDVDEQAEEADEPDNKKGRIVKPEGSHLTVLDTFKNIAPVNDAVLVDVAGSGQNEIVTCSGGFSTGSLNIVRNGAEFQEAANVVGIHNINAVWAVKSAFEERTHAYMITATHEKTLAFRINDNGRETTFSYLDSTTARDFVTTEPTINVANVRKKSFVNKKAVYQNSRWIVQVIATGVHLLEHDTVLGGFNERARWVPPPSADSRPIDIVVASINASQIVLGLSGKRLIVLRWNELGTAFEVVADKYLIAEISAVSCEPSDTTTPYTRFFAVGYWDHTGEGDATNDTSIEIFGLEKQTKPGAGGELALKSVAKISRKRVPALPRSLLLHDFGTKNDALQHCYLLCGLADGTIVHFWWKDGQPRDHKLVSLGYTPIHLSTCEIDGKRCVLAVGNRAAVFSYDRKRLIHSPVMLKDLRGACSLNTSTFPGAFVLGTQQGLTIGSVKDIGKLSIRTIPMGYDNPQRIIHVPLLGAFAVACTTYEPTHVGSAAIYKSCLKLMDDTFFEVLSQFNSDSDEILSSLITFTHKVGGKEVSIICAGTTSPTKGRLLLFTTASSETTRFNQELNLITSIEVNGQAVNALLLVDGYVVAAVDSAVISYSIGAKDPGTPSIELKQLSEWNHNYIVRSLGSFKNRIVIGDIASSVSMVDLYRGALMAVGRDYAPLFPFALEALSEDTLIGGNDASNLFTFSLGDGPRKSLERDGSYFLGDLATKFIRGSISSDFTSETFEPEAIFLTSCGKVGVVIDIKDQDMAVHLSELQRNLSAQVTGVGTTNHTRFRAPRNRRSRTDAEPSGFGFIDGDFVETFLGMTGNQDTVAKVIAGESEPERLRLSTEDIKRTLETLQNLH